MTARPRGERVAGRLDRSTARAGGEQSEGLDLVDVFQELHQLRPCPRSIDSPGLVHTDDSRPRGEQRRRSEQVDVFQDLHLANVVIPPPRPMKKERVCEMPGVSLCRPRKGWERTQDGGTTGGAGPIANR